MHETGFKAALTRVLNAYGIKYGMIKEGDKVSGEDVREGITAVISVKLTEAQFEARPSQAGQRLYPHAGGRPCLRPAVGVSGGASGGGPAPFWIRR